MVDLLGELLRRHPTAFAHTVLTATYLLEGLTEVVITGDRPDLLDVVRRAVAARRRAGLGRADLLAPVAGPGRVPAYVCRNHACRLPADDADTLSLPARWPRTIR